MSDNNYYNYCDQCGKATEKRADNLFVCPNCNNTMYVNPKPCNVAVIINENNQLLLCKRKFDPHANSWDLPGGFVTINETVEQSLIREIHEELSIDISENQFIFFKSYNDRYFYSKKSYYTLGLVFILKLTEEQINQMQPSDDISEFKFYDLYAIPVEEIKFPSIINTINDLKADLFS